MARETQSVVKMSRREGFALHPKAHKALIKRTVMPGQTNTRRFSHSKASQYALQLREKQKVKRFYGLLEKQFRNLMKDASRAKGQTGLQLLQYLESRADNIVYRAGFAPSRQAARQLVNHGHFELNGRRMNIPSARLKIGDKIAVRDRSKSNTYFKQLDDTSPAPSIVPGWLKPNRKDLSITITGLPTRDEIEPGINEQLIVEYYSR